MNKWMKNEQARKNIATRYLMVELWYEYRLRLKRGENPVNYAERVWRREIDFIPDDEIVSFQDKIVATINEIKGDQTYQALINGIASDELIQEIEEDYEGIWPKRCKK